jgi:hypothetical protein
MEIDLSFAAKEFGVLRRVIEDAQTVLKLTRRCEVDEVREGSVVTTDITGHETCLLAQTNVNPAARLDAKIWIADDELKGGIMTAAREEFLRGRRALGEGGVYR